MPRPRYLLPCVFAALAVGLSRAGSRPVGAKPPESETRVRNVLVYSYCWGWNHSDGITGLEGAVAALARKRGFAYEVVKERVALAPDFLARFDVLVWNNNFDAKGSILDSASRAAVLEYIRAGGGWVGVHGALDSDGGWAEFGGLIGVSQNSWLQANGADLEVDGEAVSHPELAHMVAGFPPRVRVLGELKRWNRTLRGTPGIIVGATLRNPAAQGILTNHDGIAEQAVWWARRHGKGRMFMTDVGHFAREYAVSDSFPVRALWEHLRYAAGDYANGCTDTASAFFDPEARIEDGSCADGVPTAIRGRTGAAAGGIAVRLDGLQPSRFELPFAPALAPAPGEALTAELLDVRGRIVWTGRISGGGGTGAAPGTGGAGGGVHNLRVTGPEPGVYLLRIRGGKRVSARPFVRRVMAVGRD